MTKENVSRRKGEGAFDTVKAGLRSRPGRRNHTSLSIMRQRRYRHDEPLPCRPGRTKWRWLYTDARTDPQTTFSRLVGATVSSPFPARLTVPQVSNRSRCTVVFDFDHPACPMPSQAKRIEDKENRRHSPTWRSAPADYRSGDPSSEPRTDNPGRAAKTRVPRGRKT